VSGIARAQSYPAKSIRFVVPFPAGGSTDVAARLIAECLTRAFAQQVYVENKSGANGTIGVEEAAKSGPDGYTILVTTDAVASNPQVYIPLVPIIQLSRQFDAPGRFVCLPGYLPVYLRVTQADGHQAWTSPIYLIE
jgi:hypothetical protein